MKIVRTLVTLAIVVLCILNAAQAVRLYYHWPVFQHDDMWYRDASMARTKQALHDLGTQRVAYLLGPGMDTADPGAYFEVQYLLTPTVLARNSAEEPFVLVNFGKGKQSAPMPGLILIEDFENGMALFRRMR